MLTESWRTGGAWRFSPAAATDRGGRGYLAILSGRRDRLIQGAD
jgi:hypothetical protein